MAFLTSVALLAAGVRSMPLRYAAAASVGYAVFLIELRIWIAAMKRRVGDSADPLDALDPGGGGSRRGGSEDVDVSDPSVWSDLSGLDGDEGGCLGVLVLLVLLAAFSAVVYVIWAAPLLLAELMLDGVIVTGVARHFRRVPRRDWLHSALRRTVVPFAILLLVVTTLGFVVQRADPEADSIGDVVRSKPR